MSPLSFTCERVLAVPTLSVYLAWTSGWGLWFAAPHSVRVSPQLGEPFFFEVEEPAVDAEPPARHPHYGRFLALDPERLVRCTWVTGPLGTDGVETVLTIQLARLDDARTCCILTHEGFGTAAARDRHAAAWPVVLEVMAERLARVANDEWAALQRVTALPRPHNRSMPDATLIPTRSYPDLDAAVGWLRDVLGCEERLRVPGERVQLTVGNGAVVVAAWDPASAPASGGRPPATLLIRVASVDDAYARALAAGASSLSAPADYPFGERQATVRDPAGHAWTLSHTVADVDPVIWGGVLRDETGAPRRT